MMLNLRALFHKSRAEQEMDDELRFHLEKQAEHNIARGMSAEEARYAALRKFGNMGQVKEECRDTWGMRFISELAQDIRFGLRQLRRNAGFTAVAIGTLALGIGANAAIFSVLYRNLIHPLPYPHAERLVMFGVVVPALDSRPFIFGFTYLGLRHEQTPFESMASWMPGVQGCDIAAPEAQRMDCAQVESTFLPTFGIRPAFGRNFTFQEDLPGAPPVCLISYGMWRSRFGSNPAALGQLLSIDGNPTRVVGILPGDFEWPTLARVDIVLPEKLPPSARGENPGVALRAYARLKPGVSIAQAGAQLQPFLQQFIQSAPPMFRKEIRLGIVPVREDQVGPVRQALWVLFGATLALLLLATANVANLLLARAEVRQRELAVRSALGAGRRRLAQLRLIESTLLGLGGGIAGLGLGFLLLRVSVALAPAGIPRIEQAHLGLPGVLFITGMSLFSGVLCGMGASLAIPPAQLLLGSRTTGSLRRRLRSALVAAQVAVSVVLLAGAGLLLRTLRNIENIPLGMDTSHVVTAEVALGRQAFLRPGEAAGFFDRLETRLSALPGVTGVALSDSLPPAGAEHSMPFFVLHPEGHPPFEKGTGGMVAWRAVTPGYFRMLDIPIIEGRSFASSDRSSQGNVIVLSKSLADRLFPAEDPVGRRVQFTSPPGPWYDVVGIAGNVKNAGIIQESDPEYYLVRKDAPDLGLHGFPDLQRHAFFLVRSPLAASGVASMVRGAISSLDSTLPAKISTLDARVGQLRTRPRFNAVLTGLFAMLGLLLAGIGLFGLVSYSVAQRTNEIGIRMALGAQKGEILRMVLGQGLKLVLAGVAIGIAGALALTRFLSSLLYGVKPTDPLTFIVVSLILAAVALLACYIPARRAARVDPMVALRYE
ncbi:MAG: ABC transporter permease [Acidobacteria bacterium]|nr:MAG: ABC transporter permease [Acidobacteriota bacterium]